MTPQKLKDGKQQLYDLHADIFEHRVVPRIFMAPARDLVASLAIPKGSHVLDVGSGTGAAARLAVEAVGKQGKVVALDPSPEMLRVAQEKGISKSDSPRRMVRRARQYPGSASAERVCQPQG